MASRKHIVFAILTVLLGVLLQNTDGATTRVTCEPMASGCIGQPFDITCDIEGDLTSGISWSDPSNRSVLTCNDQGVCIPLPGYQLLSGTTTRQVLRVATLSPRDGGVWQCKDGGGAVDSRCNVSVLEPPSISNVKAMCHRTGKGDDFLASCSGITAPGSPRASLAMKWDGGSRQNVSENTNYTINGLSGNEVTCSVVGPSTKCLKDVSISASTICPGAESRPSVGLIIGVVLACLVLIVIAADLFRCKARNEGFFHFLYGKMRSGSETLATEDSAQKVPSGDADVEKNVPEKKPLLEEKADDKTSATIAEETKPTQEVSTELEPEDKDPEVVPIVDTDELERKEEAPPIKPRSKIGGETEEKATESK